MYDLEDVVLAVKHAVADYGEDWVDPNAVAGDLCRYNYNHRGEARHCIVGHVLNQYGFTIDEKANLVGVLGLPPRIREGFTEEALRFLSGAQVLQDNKLTWGDVLRNVIDGFIGGDDV